MRCAAARAAQGAHRGGDGLIRELQALTEMTYSLIAERRRHRPRGAAGGGPGAAGRDLLNGSALPGKATGDAARRAAAAHRNARWGRIRRCPSSRLSGSDSWASGSWAHGWPRTSRRAGFALSVWTHTPGKARGVGRRARRRAAWPTPAEVAERSDIVISMVVDGEQVASILLGPGGVIEAARPGAPVHRHVHDRPARDAADRGGAGRAGRRHARRARHRLLAARAGRHARDHGGRRGGQLRSVRCPRCRRWAR